MSLQIKTTERKPGYFEVGLSGRLDSSTYQELDNKLNYLYGSAAKAIVLDFSALEYISSMGLRVVFKAVKDMKASGGVFMMTNMQPAIKKVFEIANAIADDSLFLSIEEADNYYQSIQDQVNKGTIKPSMS